MLASILLAPVLLVLGTPAQDTPPAPDPERVKGAVEELSQAFRKGDKAARINALDRASEVPAPEVVKAVVVGFRDDERDVRAATIQSLRWLDHPTALRALHKAAKGDRALRKDEELYPAVLKAVGQHADASSVALLSKKPFDSPFYQAGRARVLGLGMIRERDSVEALFGMMKSSSAREVERHMGSFRISLMVLTGTDQGPSKEQWLRWWNAHKKGLVVSPTRRELPREIARTWTDYWGLDDDYGRTRRREDRGDD